MAGPMLMKHPNPNQTGPLYQSEKVAFFFSTLSYFIFSIFLALKSSFLRDFVYFFCTLALLIEFPPYLCLYLSLSLCHNLFFFFFLLYSLHDLNLSFAVDILSLVTILLVSSLFVYKKTAHL